MDKGFVQTLHNSNQCSTVTGGCTPPMGVGGWGTPGVTSSGEWGGCATEPYRTPSTQSTKATQSTKSRRCSNST